LEDVKKVAEVAKTCPTYNKRIIAHHSRHKGSFLSH